MYENKWSPFDPEWYKKAFDKFISTADELFNQEDIINQGYVIPDADGSRSSVFRNNSVLNNSFNEKALRDTLKDIYLNSVNTLTASNHDSTQFYQYQINMKDVELSPNTGMCQFIIPSDQFFSSDRDKFKMSQLYRKWISIDEILNNHDIFNWTYLVFINQKIYDKYEIRIDDHQVTIRFPYKQSWVDNQYPVYVYKFTTNSSSRITLTQWDIRTKYSWKIPLSDINNSTLSNSDHCIVIFNDGSLGDNIEFAPIKDGYIYIDQISQFNKNLVASNENIDISIIVPKFFHEYPIMLPTDVVFRPYIFDMSPVTINTDGEMYNVKSNDSPYKQVYTNIDDHINEHQNGWKYIIRPIVLSDAFKEDLGDPYIEIGNELSVLQDYTIKAADLVEELKFSSYDEELINKVDTILNRIHEYHNSYLINKKMELNEEYDIAFKKYQDSIQVVKEKRNLNIEFSENGKNQSIWQIISPCIYMPRDIVDRYNVAIKINHASRHNGGRVWCDFNKYKNKLRYTRPIDATDFWTFEYDMEKEVWRPYMLSVEHHFPDVYTFIDSNEVTPTPNRIFKAFFFYSDNINTRKLSTNITNSTPSWDTDMESFMYNKGGVYRDIFMEKFYWMGIQAVYQGIIQTKYRWELIEYIIDNDSYDRFNQLFLKSMDPYFKLGLATYLKSDNYGFPFDDAVDKLKESMSQQFLGYEKITNYEMYLNKTWISSYFDFIEKIIKNYDYTDRLIRRPRTTFDTNRLLPIMIDIQSQINVLVNKFDDELKSIINTLNDESYGLSVESISQIQTSLGILKSNLDKIIDSTSNLDIDIYSIADINYIISLSNKHQSLLRDILQLCIDACGTEFEDPAYKEKYNVYTQLQELINKFKEEINKINPINLDIDFLIKTILDPSVESINDVLNDSIIGNINQFIHPWNDDVKNARNDLYVSTVAFSQLYDKTKSYELSDIENITNAIGDVNVKLTKLLFAIENQNIIDHSIIDRITYASEYCGKIIIALYDIKLINDNILNIRFDMQKIHMNIDTFIFDEKYQYSMIFKIFDSIVESHNKIFVNKNEDDMKFIELDKCMNELFNLNTFEHNLFDSIYALINPDTGMYPQLEYYNPIIDSIIDYMDTVNSPYSPDTQSSDFSYVYKVTEVKIDNNGFNHNLGDIIYVPKVGICKITNIDDTVSVAMVESRNTSFRDARWTTREYDSITSGTGVGLTVSPLKVDTITLIDDTPATTYISRISNCINEIYNNITAYNPITNTSLNITIENIKTIKDEWDLLMETYNDHMSFDLSNQVSDALLSSYECIDKLNDFEFIRSCIKANEFVSQFETFLATSYSLYDETYGITPNYKQYDSRMRNAYNSLVSFIGNGSSWTNVNQLLSLMNSALTEVSLFNKMILKDVSQEFINIVKPYMDEMNSIYNNSKQAKDDIDLAREDINQYLDSLVIFINDIPSERVVDKLYYIVSITVAESGSGYSVGDVVEIIPQLPSNYKGEVIHDNEDIIMNDKIYIQIKQVNELGGVIKAEALIQYNALPYQLNGARKTIACFGNGSGFIPYIATIENNINNVSTIDTTSQKFDENDLLKYDFPNAHNLDIGYEVFIGGKQCNDYIVRHTSEHTDSVYINANQVAELENTVITTKGEHYYTYKLDRLEIIDPGAGYSVGQTIWIKTDSIPLKLIVTELDGTPLNGIKSVELAENKSAYKGNPSSSNAEAIRDSMNNIDDEYSGTYYDEITQDGIDKPATFSFDPNEFVFTSVRFDNLESGDRNQFFMYRDIDKPVGAPDGDSDYHWYQGSEYNSIHKWLRITPLVPTKDSNENIVPPNQPRNSEFQFIKRLRIHDSSSETIPTLKPINNDDINTIVEDTSKADASEDFEFDSYIISPIPNSDIEGMYDGTITGEVNDPIPCDDGEIIGIDVSIIKDIMLGNRVGEITLPYIDGSVLASDINDVFAITFINNAMKSGIIEVETHDNLPMHISEWPTAKIGDGVIVNKDINGHRMLYRLRTFSGTGGYFVYERPGIADYKWNTFRINWNEDNFYPDYPDEKAIYRKYWRDNSENINRRKYSYIENTIDDGKVDPVVTPIKYHGTYVSDITIDDLSVYNNTKYEWEDLSSDKWELTVDDQGFTLSYHEDGAYSYDMSLYINKKPDNQMRNTSLKRNATFDISAVISGEVNTTGVNNSVNVGNDVRIRTLYPFTQRESFIIGGDYSYTMNFRICNYPHYRNELHLEDIQIYNKSAGRFEDVLNSKLFEVRFKDTKAVSRGKETQTNIIQSMISNAGTNYVDGEIWGYNEEYKTHIFGNILVDHNTGSIIRFTPTHTVNAPTTDITIDFKLNQSGNTSGSVIMEFQTSQTTVYEDGYIHNVTNKLAPLPKEFQIVCLYNLDEPGEYEVTLSTSPKVWEFVLDTDQVFPTFHIPGYIIPQDHLYILGSKGRYPLVNPSTGKPSIVVTHTDEGTDVKFLNLYYAYDHIEIHYLPYPIRSIYTKRKVPSSGYIDLSGKINKPLNKKYFEFWMNGRLLNDEVTIITPTKLFVHGCKSLRNFEIIEINRDANEYFADDFLTTETSDDGIVTPKWNLVTYLDDALTGNLSGENYTTQEQALLIKPVWPQVESTDDEFINYPPNMDTESDILLKIDENFVAVSDAVSSYQYTVIDVPTVEGTPVNEQTLSFVRFGFRPITEDMIINMLNEEWAKEMEEGLLPTHTVISEDEWYGILARLYDKNGVQVYSLNEAAYKITDPNILRINNSTKLVRIVKGTQTYDLT